MHIVYNAQKVHSPPNTMTSVLEAVKECHAVANAVARALPLFSLKSTKPSSAVAPRPVTVSFSCPATSEYASEVSADQLAAMAVTAQAVRGAARLVDTPPEEMNTLRLVQEAVDVVARLNSDVSVEGEVSIATIQGEDLDAQGYGGIYGVGKGAKEPPALVVLSYTPNGHAGTEHSTMAWVGKG